MQVVIRSLRVLALVGEGRPDGLSLTEIASELGLPLPTVHRILKLLVAERMVYKDPHSNQHFPGPKLWALARPASSSMVGELAGPHVRALSKRFDETVFVTQLVGPRAVCVALAESQRPLRISVDIGREMPLHAAASARVILAYRDDKSVESLLAGYDMTRFTANTPQSSDEVMLRLEKIRKQGFDMSADELDDNVWAVAVPVRIEGEVAASLTIAAPVERMTDDGTQAQMLEAAGQVQRALEEIL